MSDDPTVTQPSLTDTAAKLPTLPDERIHWGLLDVALGLLVFLTLLVVGSLVLSLPALQEAVSFEAAGFAGSVIAYAGLFAVVVVASRRSGLRSLAADFGLHFRPVDLAIGLGLGIGARIFTAVLTAVVIAITGYTPERGNFELSTEPLWIVLNGFVIAALLAPFVEELFFRGLLQRSVFNRVLRRGRGTEAAHRRAVSWSIAVSGVLFMLLHMYQATNLTFAIILGGSTLVVGLAHAAVSQLTGRIGAAVVSHVVFNGSAVLLALVAQQLG